MKMAMKINFNCRNLDFLKAWIQTNLKKFRQTWIQTDNLHPCTNHFYFPKKWFLLMDSICKINNFQLLNKNISCLDCQDKFIIPRRVEGRAKNLAWEIQYQMEWPCWIKLSSRSLFPCHVLSEMALHCWYHELSVMVGLNWHPEGATWIFSVVHMRDQRNKGLFFEAKCDSFRFCFLNSIKGRLGIIFQTSPKTYLG